MGSGFQPGSDTELELVPHRRQACAQRLGRSRPRGSRGPDAPPLWPQPRAGPWRHPARVSGQLGLSRRPRPPAGQRGRRGGRGPPWGEGPRSHQSPTACLQLGHTAAESTAVRTSHLCQRGLLRPETAPRALRVRVPQASPIPSLGVRVTSREDPRGHRQVSCPHLSALPTASKKPS